MKLLVVLSRFPYPLEKGDKLRAYNQIRILAKKHDIFLFALTDQKVKSNSLDALKPFCKEIHIEKINFWSKISSMFAFWIKGLPFQCGYFFRPKAHRHLKKFFEDIKPNKIYCQLVRTAEYVKDFSVDKTIDYQDVLSKGMLRRYNMAPFYLKPFFKMEYKRLLKYEAKSFQWFDHHTIITTVDRELMPVNEKDRIVVVRNGVSLEDYHYNQQEKKYDLIFTGNMGYAPNVDAAEFIVNQILPKVRQYFPNISLVLCGADPSKRVLALQSDNVKVTGWVDSMAEYYAGAKIFIAPMRLGTGLQNKLLEAMAMQLPCITSPLAGRPLIDVEDNNAALICNTVDEFASSICKLLTNKNLYDKMSQNGYQYVRQNYDWDNATQVLESVLS